MNSCDARIAFFARVPDPSMLERVGFYSADIEALRATGAEVLTATRIRDLPWRADVYFVWWWTFALPVVVWARLTGRPVFITGTMHLGASAADGGYEFRPWLQRQLMAWSAKLATRNLCVSKGEMDGMAEAFGGTNYSYYPHAVEVPEADEGTPSERLQQVFTTAGAGVLVLSVAWSSGGNLMRKCVYELTEGFELLADRHPQVHLVLCGNRGDAHHALLQRATSSRHADRIHCLGQVTQQEKAQLFARADVMASPSRYEGFGVAIAEAAALGVPVLTSRVGAVPEVLGDGALYCNGEDPEDIAAGLSRLIFDSKLRDQLAQRGRFAARRFSQAAKNDLTREYLGKYANLTEPPPVVGRTD